MNPIVTGEQTEERMARFSLLVATLGNAISRNSNRRYELPRRSILSGRSRVNRRWFVDELTPGR